jgi:hypothetical protein
VVAHRRELDERDLVEAGVEIRGDLHRQPGLAYATGTGQRDQPGGPVQDERSKASCFLLSSDQAGEIRRWAADPERRLPAARDRPDRVPSATVGTTSIGHRREPSV